MTITSQPASPDDVVIIGAGIIGLSVGYELAKRGLSTRIIDAKSPGREASWAGAGILPPPTELGSDHPLEALRRLSYRLHFEWSNELRESTGIDNEYRRCGGLYLARSSGELASLLAQQMVWNEEQVENRYLDRSDFGAEFPSLKELTDDAKFRAAVFLPEEAQIRNPRHLQALQNACERLGVTIESNNPAIEFESHGGQVVSLRTELGVRKANSYCVAAGSWSQQLLTSAGQHLGVFPMRGQMLLFRVKDPLFRPIINEGSRYVVPRLDGHVLVGSSEEEVGFDNSTSQNVIEDLQEFASGIHPALSAANRVKAWSGLRPCSLDGMPYIGKLPAKENLFVASGHFRSGLYLSTGTARTLAQLIMGEQPEIELTPFHCSRG